MRASGKRLLQQQPQPEVLLLVDRDDEHRVVRVQQLLRQQQPSLHERQPLGVPVVVVALDVVVVVLPVLRARVVRRVDVDAVDLAAVREEQRLERVEVLGVDDRVERLVAAAFHLPRRDQARVDRVAELGHHDQVVQRQRSRRASPSSTACSQIADAASRLQRRRPAERSIRDDPPQPLVRPSWASCRAAAAGRAPCRPSGPCAPGARRLPAGAARSSARTRAGRRARRPPARGPGQARVPSVRSSRSRSFSRDTVIPYTDRSRCVTSGSVTR